MQSREARGKGIRGKEKKGGKGEGEEKEKVMERRSGEKELREGKGGRLEREGEERGK